MNGTALDWQPPERLLARIAAQPGDLVFLHSSLRTGYSGAHSYLAFGEDASYRGDDWAEIAAFLARHAGQDSPAVFGYLGYELLHGLEQVERSAPSILPMPPAWLFHPRQLLTWDHAGERLSLRGDAIIPPTATVDAPYIPSPIRDLRSNMSRTEYLAAIRATTEAIARGDFYQANITRKFHGEFAAAIDPVAIFSALMERTPAPYAAYLREGDRHILSSSPELFLRADPSGTIESRPIKGTRRRMGDEDEAAARAALAGSAKDRAENLMIVDLMRHDLARVCLPGSLDASRRFEVDSFRTLHHLSSSIRGQLAEGVTPIEAVRAAFPPGSMTGAPKIAAMRWCADQEALQRGVYSGALGWFGERAMELSVVIRTLVIEGRRFEFQVGGGIVAESDPVTEWEETLTKARGIAQTLGISEAALAAL